YEYVLQCSGAIIAHSSLELLSSSDPPASVSQSAGITGVNHNTQPMFYVLVSEATSVFYQLNLRSCPHVWQKSSSS
uniref:Uncharacterized protein n=1 Tax=Prolemur simus TaxID=1328070 RepID=A0A8C8YN78_PROSS